MSALHEPGEVWHVGWDWYAHMWFVEPPFDVELDEPIKWFNERYQAFDFIDEWIIKQPVQVGVVEQSEVSQGVAALPEDEDYAQEPPPEPVRHLSVAPVHIPTVEEARTAQEQRLAEYNARVGIK